MDEETLKEAINVITPILFGLAGTLATLMFVITRCQLDNSMIILTSVFLICFFARLLFIDDIVSKKDDNPIFVSAFLLIFAMLYFFVFEMRRLRDKITSDSVAENLQKCKRTNFIKSIIAGLFIVGNAAIILSYVVYLNF